MSLICKIVPIKRIINVVLISSAVWGTSVAHQVFAAPLLNVAGPGLPLHFDPHAVSDGLTRRFLNSTYQALVEADAMGQIQPALADRWERVDARTWRFHLRSDVTFPQGEILNASDVIFSLDRARRPWSPWRVALRNIQMVQSLGEGRSVEIVLSTPDPAWLRVLSGIKIVGRQCCVLSRRGKTSDFDMDSPGVLPRMSYGTGPLQAKRRESPMAGRGVTKIILTPTGRINEWVESWWERIEYSAIPSDEQRLKAVLDGHIDVALDVNPDRTHTTRSAEMLSRLASVEAPSSRLLVLIWPWAMQTDRSAALATQRPIVRLLQTPDFYRGSQTWAKPDVVWEDYWGQQNVQHEIPPKKEEQSLPPDVGQAKEPASWIFQEVLDRGGVYMQVIPELVRALRNEGVLVATNGVNASTLAEGLQVGKVHAALVEWAPYSESASASLFALVYSVCPAMMSKDVPGCKDLWSAYEAIGDHSSVTQGHLSSSAWLKPAKAFEAIKRLNQNYGWWIPVARLMPSHFHQSNVRLLPRYDGEIDFNGILPKEEGSVGITH